MTSADKRLEKLIGRCETKDTHDFPDLKEGDNRCMTCVIWETVEALIKEECRKARLDELRWAYEMARGNIVTKSYVEGRLEELSEEDK